MKNSLSTLTIGFVLVASLTVLIGCEKEPGPSEAPPDAVTKTADEFSRENGGSRQKLGESGGKTGAPEGGRADRSGG